MFEKITEEARFLSPLKGFEEETQIIEHRKDPLTGRWTRINIQRAKRYKQSQRKSDYSELARESRENCFFCPENIEKKTPKFRPDLIPGGVITRGETRVFPNLYPFAKYHAVGTVSQKHFLRTGEFKEKQMYDTLTAGLDFIEEVHSKDRDARFPTFSWNHLFPSGASILHPHVQIITDRRPTYMAKWLMEASKRYFERRGNNYWSDLVREEKGLKERYIGAIGSITFLAGYSPFGNGEVLIVFDNRSSLAELEDKDVSRLSKGVIKILNGYAAMGVESFNLGTYSGPLDEETAGFNLHIRLVARPAPTQYHTSDMGFMETLHFEKVVEMLPEDLTAIMKRQF